MKYQLEKKEIKSINDLIEFKNYIDEQYNKEKNELETTNQNVSPSLYGQYLDVFVRTLTNMMKTAYLDGNQSDSKLMVSLSRVFKMKIKRVNDGGEYKLYAVDFTKAVSGNKVYDKTFNAIMDGKLEDILEAFKDVEDLDEIISDAVAETNNYEEKKAFTDDLKEKYAKATNSKKNHRNNTNEKKNNKLKNKMMNNWNNDPTSKATPERLDKLEFERKEGLLQSAKLAGKTGKRVNIARGFNVDDISENEMDFNEIESKEELDLVFSKTTITTGSFADVRNSLKSKIDYYNEISSFNDGAILTSDIKKAMAIDLYSQMAKIRNDRGFFEKVFHPFQNSKEKKLFKNLKDECISVGVTKDELDSALGQDFDIKNVINDLANKSGLLENSISDRNSIEVDELKNNPKEIDINNSLDLSLNKSKENNMNINK